MVDSYAFDLYIGSQYGSRVISFEELCSKIQEFQGDEFCSVNVSECRVLAGKFWEDSFKITAINYPRFPKTALETELWMSCLGQYLSRYFNQSITLVGPENTRFWSHNE